MLADQEGAAFVSPPVKKALASFFKKSTTTSTNLTQRQDIENELSRCLESVSAESDTDPLKLKEGI